MEWVREKHSLSWMCFSTLVLIIFRMEKKNRISLGANWAKLWELNSHEQSDDKSLDFTTTFNVIICLSIAVAIINSETWEVYFWEVALKALKRVLSISCDYRCSIHYYTHKVQVTSARIWLTQISSMHRSSFTSPSEWKWGFSARVSRKWKLCNQFASIYLHVMFCSRFCGLTMWLT